MTLAHASVTARTRSSMEENSSPAPVPASRTNSRMLETDVGLAEKLGVKWKAPGRGDPGNPFNPHSGTGANSSLRPPGLRGSTRCARLDAGVWLGLFEWPVLKQLRERDLSGFGASAF